MSRLPDLPDIRNPDPAEFVDALRSFLEALNLPQAVVARRAGVSQFQFSRWVRNHVTPSLESRLKVYNACKAILREVAR